jgi:hypothetical protein
MIKPIWTILLSGAALAGAVGLTTIPVNAQPGGSYVESCREIRASGDSVSAVCRRMDGSWERTEVRGCRGGIANMNGHLTCGGGREGYGSSYGPGYDRDRDYRGQYDRGPSGPGDRGPYPYR